MDKNGTLTIKDFHQGIADSPLTGFTRMKNIEVWEKEGVAKMQYRSALSFNTSSLPIAISQDSFGNVYVGCENGQFYKNGTYVGTCSNRIHDTKIISDNTTTGEYVLIACDSVLYAYGPTYSVGAQLFSNVFSASLNTSWAHPLNVGIDLSTNNTPVIYVGDGNKVGAITSFTAGVVGIAPTASYNSGALTIQPNHFVRTLGTLGKYLVIGTQGGSVYTDYINSKTAAVILWDRTSPSFNLPVFFHENGVSQYIQFQNRGYLGIGTRGRIYETDGANFQELRKLPFTYNRQFGARVKLYPNAICIHNGELLIGVSSYGDTYPSTSQIGVYALPMADVQIANTIIPNATVLRHTISTESDGTTSAVSIGSLYSTAQDTLYIGWQDGNIYGIDIVDYKTSPDYTASFETALIRVGTELQKATFKRLEIQLTKPLATDSGSSPAQQKIRVSWRGNDTDSYTQIGEYTTANFGSNNVFNTAANLASLTNLQLKVDMKQSTTALFGNNIELISVALYPSEK